MELGKQPAEKAKQQMLSKRKQNLIKSHANLERNGPEHSEER